MLAMFTAPSFIFFLACLVQTGVGEDLADITCLDPNIDSTLIQIARLQKSIVTDLDSKIDSNDNQIEEIKTLVAELTLDLGTLNNKSRDEIAALNEKLDDATNKIRSQEDQLEAQLDAIDTLKTESAVTNTHLTAAESEISRLQIELDQTAKLSGDGRISSSILPGSYADYTLEDVQWQSLHMAAAAACRGSTPTGGSGSHANAVIPFKSGSNCNDMCRNSGLYTNCDAAVTLNGWNKQAASDGTIVGYFYNYGCANNQVHNYDERNYQSEFILAPSTYITYCCCRK